MGESGEQGLVDVPEAKSSLTGLLLLIRFHPMLGGCGKVARPGGERKHHLTGRGVSGMEHLAGIEKRRSRLLPEIAMTGKLDIVEAKFGHERGVMRGEEMRVVAQTRVSGRDAL